MIAAVLVKLLPWIGPWLAKAVPWLARTQAALPVLGVRAAAIGTACGLLAVGVGVWMIWGWIAERHAAHATATTIAGQAQSICTAANQAAEIKVLRAAAQEREHAATFQERRAIAAETALTLLSASQEAARHASPDPDKILIPAGDPWLVRRAGRTDGGAAGGVHAGAGGGRVESAARR